MSEACHYAVYRLITTSDLQTGNRRTRRSHLDTFGTLEAAEEFRDEKAEEIKRLSRERARLSIKEIPGSLNASNSEDSP